MSSPSPQPLPELATPAASGASSSGRCLLGRWLEVALLFGVTPGLLTLAPRWFVSVAIVAGGVACLIALLRDPTFARRQLFGAPEARRGLPRVLARTAVVWIGLLVIVLVARSEELFNLPRTRPWVWAAVMVGYPVISSFAQEIIFRTLVFHRYARLLPDSARMRIVFSAALFGWAHILLHNLPAVLLSAAGGLLFASTYERSRSTLLVTIEHGLYGCFIFTVGLGDLFYRSG